VAARERELLPVGYVHLVFTVPEPLARLALANKRVVYDLLFRATAATLLQVAANPKRLSAAIGASWSFIAGGNASSRTLTHDAWHHHLLCFPGITAAGRPRSPREVRACLSDEAAR
jgi:hypothetical protein